MPGIESRQGFQDIDLRKADEDIQIGILAEDPQARFRNKRARSPFREILARQGEVGFTDTWIAIYDTFLDQLSEDEQKETRKKGSIDQYHHVPATPELGIKIDELLTRTKGKYAYIFGQNACRYRYKDTTPMHIEDAFLTDEGTYTLKGKGFIFELPSETQPVLHFSLTLDRYSPRDIRGIKVKERLWLTVASEPRAIIRMNKLMLDNQRPITAEQINELTRIFTLIQQSRKNSSKPE